MLVSTTSHESEVGRFKEELEILLVPGLELSIPSQSTTLRRLKVTAAENLIVVEGDWDGCAEGPRINAEQGVLILDGAERIELLNLPRWVDGPGITSETKGCNLRITLPLRKHQGNATGITPGFPQHFPQFAGAY